MSLPDEVEAPFAEVEALEGSLEVGTEEPALALLVGDPVNEERSEAAMVEVTTTTDWLAVVVTATVTTVADMAGASLACGAAECHDLPTTALSCQSFVAALERSIEIGFGEGMVLSKRQSKRRAILGAVHVFTRLSRAAAAAIVDMNSSKDRD